MLGWIPWCQEKQQPSSDDSSIDQTSSSPVVSHGDSSTPPKVIAVRGSRPVWVLFVQDIVTNVMGACLSGGGATQIIELADGDEAAFHDRFIEDRVLGEGEFGVVKLVHDMKESKARGTDTAPNALACKTLRKGVVFKDNTLFAPLKPEILQGEVNMLRSLGGAHFCLLLIGVYETPRAILMVTEYCAGGEMMEYVSKQEEDLRTDDVSRVSFQMLDAVNHCAKHGIIHRDIKPENVMFQYPTPGSDLRLIDFGSGTNKPTLVEGQNHTTFAGSAFYISPEMFQRTYTQKTDVWSVGVALYVLVAGYPAEVLQRAFNLLQSANRDLKQLPNMPPNMPESYYDMLEGLLVYRHKNRKSAGEMLTHEFVQFHQMAFTIDQISMEAQVEANGQALKDTTGIGNRKRTQSFSLKGSVGRHSLFMDYQKFERSLTALLATLLDRKELVALLDALQEKMNANESKPEQKPVDNKDETTTTTKQAQMAPHEKTLDVIPIRELKTILEAQKQDQV
jgi:calcium/calmodulin-dependent protein kinase I